MSNSVETLFPTGPGKLSPGVFDRLKRNREEYKRRILYREHGNHENLQEAIKKLKFLDVCYGDTNILALYLADGYCVHRLDRGYLSVTNVVGVLSASFSENELMYEKLLPSKEEMEEALVYYYKLQIIGYFAQDNE